MSEHLVREMDRHGFVVMPGVLSVDDRQRLIGSLGKVSGPGRRGLLGAEFVARLARSATLLDLVRPHLPSRGFPVRALYFDKTTTTNWLVPWHQDLTLAVRARVEIPGFGPWSAKQGIPHVQPPADVLAQMLTVRLHLDDANESNGALRVLSGSHRFGILGRARIAELRRELEEVVCCAAAGGALLMRPLLLHASSRSRAARPRRVLHLEYAGVALPAGMEWHEAA